jgi:hypothetical protein
MLKGYTTRQEVENYLLITIDASFYAQVDAWIESVEAYIDRRTGRNFVADVAASVRKYDGDGSNIQLIDDAVAITKVEVDDEEIVPDSSTEEGYFAYPTNDLPKTKLETDGNLFAQGRQNVEVTAKWGYSVAVPTDIKRAATVFVAGIINFSDEGKGEVSSETIGAYSVSYKTTQERDDFNRAIETLKAYKKFTF